MKLLYLLEPSDHAFLNMLLPALPNGAPAEFDFIQHFYGKPNMTHAWNEFRLRPELVDEVLKG